MKKWERFERLTAALHVYEMSGAAVTWNDEIHGYQIDVSVRFRQGSYSYLQIIECRDKGRPTSRDEIAAFSKKVEKTQANKGVFVSAAGFQAGALKLAGEENIDTFVLREIPEDWPAQVVAKLPISRIIGIRRVRVRVKGTDGWLEPISAARPVRFSRIKFLSPQGRLVSVHAAMQGTIPVDWAERVGPWEMQIHLIDGDWLLPLRDIVVPVDAFRVLAETIPLPETIIARLPPEQRPTRVEYHKVVDGTKTTVSDRDLPFGLTGEVEPGHFYQDVGGREYYCESQSGDRVRLILLASVQHGRRFFAQMTGTKDHLKGAFVVVDEPQALQRLRSAYAEWLEAKRLGRGTGNVIADPENGAVYVNLDDV